MSSYENLEHLVAKCRRNRESVKEEDLRGKYRKSYGKLTKSICKEAEGLFTQLLLSAFQVLPEDSNVLTDGILMVVEDAKGKKYPQMLGNALVKYCDIELFFAYIQLLQCEIAETTYMDYWLSHITQQGGESYNSIIDMQYDPNASVWGTPERFQVGYPPEKESFLSEVADRKQKIQKVIEKRSAPECIVRCA